MSTQEESQPEVVDIERLINHLQSIVGSQLVEIAKAQLLIDDKNHTIKAQALVIDEYERKFGDLPSELEPREIKGNGLKEKIK